MALNNSANAAEQLRLDYKSFYSHLRQLDDEQLSDLQFAFGFKLVNSQELCTVEEVYVHTDKLDIPVVVDTRNRFVLPTEKALKLAQAVVVIDLLPAANKCDLSVQLEVSPDALTESIGIKELRRYFAAFAAFFKEMGGMLSFLMPSPDGLIIYLNDTSSLQDPWRQHLDSSQKKLLINKTELETISFSALDSASVSHITAQMAQ
ncbi:MAG: DUF2987 domain-containing protein [Aestuariibacter sp.]